MVRAQSGAVSIQGTIQDATGAAVPTCSVHVANQKSGVTTTTTSNEIGCYPVPGLFAGGYTVTFSAAGMKKYEPASPCRIPKSRFCGTVSTFLDANALTSSRKTAAAHNFGPDRFP